jgi:protoporphyrinogen oxidase
MNPEIGILGGGISGIALAAHLEAPCRVLEAAPRAGGLCASVIEDGFTFDAAGPHIMFSKNKDVLGRMVAALGTNVHERRRENRIWFKGRLVKYPFENGLGDLPKEDCFECILGYLRNPWTKPPENLQEWSYATFGAGISEKYFLPYNRKIWNVDPAEISLEWVARIPKPPLEDVLKSAIGIPTEGYLHQLYFHYPRTGGYEALVHAFASRLPAGTLCVDCPATRLRGGPGAWEVDTPRGTLGFKTLVSTLPIHELARIWEGFPAGALEGLRFNSLINVLIGVRGSLDRPQTAIYVPDAGIPFHRLSFPRNFSEQCVPEGCDAVMAEITCSPGDPEAAMDDRELLRETEGHLRAMGMLGDTVPVYRKVMRFPYGYPIYDRQYHARVARMRAAVADRGVHLLGRFAEFDYINTDVCVERALALAGILAPWPGAGAQGSDR